MKLKLENSVSSPQDLQAVILEIRDYERWLGHNSVKKRLDIKAKHSEQPVMSPAALALVREWSTKMPLGQKSLDELLETLTDFQDTAPRVTITLAAPAGGGLKKTLVAWCRENIAPDVLVTFEFNSTLLGGMAVRYGSRIFDWSFRRQILAARDRFPEVLRHV